MATGRQNIHATCVSVAGRGVLILGPSGSGKTTLALGLLSMGAVLVSDDRTDIVADGGRMLAYPPVEIAGMIEARGVGLIRLPYAASAPVALGIDMSRIETERLPQRHVVTVLDMELPCLHKVDAPHFPAAVHTYLTGMAIEVS